MSLPAAADARGDGNIPACGCASSAQRWDRWLVEIGEGVGEDRQCQLAATEFC